MQVALTLLAPILFMFAVVIIQNGHLSTLRMNSFNNNQHVQDSKIIIAIQLNSIFAYISNRMNHGFLELDIQRRGLAKLLYYCFGKGAVYYQAKVRDKNCIRDFIEGLLQTQKVQLYLYTKLTPEITDALLKKLNLSQYFKNSRRKYQREGDQHKHPTDINSQTRRVIILTDSKQNFIEEDSKYFLIVRREDLKRYGKQLSELIRNNTNIDELHNELTTWKINQLGY